MFQGKNFDALHSKTKRFKVLNKKEAEAYMRRL